MKSEKPKQPRAFNVMAKPVGALCNLNCTYCYYLEKRGLYAEEKLPRMSDAVLEAFVRDYIAAQDVPEVQFVWQGGEPTLLAELCSTTNGRRFSPTTRFSSGSVSTVRGNCTTRGVRCARERRRSSSLCGAEFNTLTVVGEHNVHRALDVYEFLREVGSGFIQFIPLVERPATPADAPMRFAGPPNLAAGTLGDALVEPWSVKPADYGDFLCKIYDVWVRRDVGRTFVQLFDVALCAWAGVPAPLCVFREKCGSALAIEHNGDVFSCDHFVYPKFRLGNVLHDSLARLADVPAQKNFGALKSAALPRVCRKCGVRFACNGECPKHRFLYAPDGEPGLNYFCAAYKKFFTHAAPTMSRMKALLEQERAPAEIMRELADA